MWLGKVSVPATTTTVAATGSFVNLYFSFNRDIFSVRNSLTNKLFRVLSSAGGIGFIHALP